MAKASVECVCKYCGQIFRKEKKVLNSKAARNWEEWAKIVFDQCPDCWGTEQREKEIAEGLGIEILLGNPFNVSMGDTREMFIVFYGDTKPIKDKIKALGGRWTDDFPKEGDEFAGGLFAGIGDIGKKPFYRWVITVKVDELEATLKKVRESLAPIIKKYPSQENVLQWQYHIINFKTMREKELGTWKEKELAKIAEQLEALGELPRWPEALSKQWPNGAKWNGKIYGRSNKKVVYLGDEKVHLTDELAEEVERVYQERIEWRKKKEVLENKRKKVLQREYV